MKKKVYVETTISCTKKNIKKIVGQKIKQILPSNKSIVIGVSHCTIEKDAEDNEVFIIHLIDGSIMKMEVNSQITLVDTGTPLILKKK